MKPAHVILFVVLVMLTLSMRATPTAFTGNYTQNFDAIGTSGTAMPAGFRTMSTGSGNSFYTAAAPISTAGIAAATVSGTQTLTVWDSGSAVASSSTKLFNAGSVGNINDRALGSDVTSVAAMVIELSLTNTIGSNLLGVVFNYDVKCLTNGNVGTEASELSGYAFFYSTSGGTTAAEWTRVDALSLGNYTQGTMSNSGNVTVTFPTPITNGGIMYFRWADDNNVANSPDQMLAIDNLVIGISTNTYVPPPASPAVLLRGPYLQSSTTNSIVIRWRTDVAINSLVVYGTNLASLNLLNTNLAAVTEHEIKLTGLLPDTKYFYTIAATNQSFFPADSNHFFLTHPWPGTTKPLRVWVIGDAGTKNANQAAVRDAFYNFNGTNTVHAWLQLGDNAYDTGTDGEYQAAVFDMYPTLLRKSVTWPTLGNHETAQSTTYVDTYPYFNIFTLPTAGEAGGVASGTEHYYSFDLGMVHFICLDSMTASRATNGAMAIWLRSDLAVNTNRWTVAFWHHPPYTKGSHNSDTEPALIEMRQNFLPLLEAGGVDLILSGHSHSYERSSFINGHYGLSSSFSTNLVVQSGSGRETNGVGAYHKPDGLGESPIGNQGAIYAVAGSSGQTSGGSLNHPAMYFSTNALGSMVLDFKSNRLDAVFIRENGLTNDWFTIVKDGTNPPRLAGPTLVPGGGLQFTVLCRAYRTNVVETATNLPGAWKAVQTNVPSATEFNFADTNAPAGGKTFYRVSRR